MKNYCFVCKEAYKDYRNVYFFKFSTLYINFIKNKFAKLYNLMISSKASSLFKIKHVIINGKGKNKPVYNRQSKRKECIYIFN